MTEGSGEKTPLDPRKRTTLSAVRGSLKAFLKRKPSEEGEEGTAPLAPLTSGRRLQDIRDEAAQRTAKRIARGVESADEEE